MAVRRLRGPAGRWLSIFAVSLGLFIVRFLVPAPVGQADNRDGPRLMCGLGLVPVTHGHARFFRYAYFEYVPNIAHFLLTHPGRIISIGQQLAALAQRFQVTTLGDYPPSAGHPPGAAFIPVAYFNGVGTTRHMAAMNLATALAFLVSAALAVSLTYQALARARQRPGTAIAPDMPELARPST